MLRNVLGRGGAAVVGAAATAAPSNSQCRAQTQHRGGLSGNVVKADKDGAQSVVDPGHLNKCLVDGSHKLDQDWLVADVHNQDVLFGPEEISEVVNTIIGLPEREAGALVGRDGVTIHELRSDGDVDSDSESSSSDANDAIAAAGMQIAHMHTQHGHFIAAVNNLLNRPDVQTVVLQALLEDPNVQDLIHDRNLVTDRARLLPPAAQAAGLAVHEMTATEVEEVTDHEDSPLLRIAERAAANIIKTAKSLREAAAAVLINLGYQIHALLGRPYKGASKASAGPAEDGSSAAQLEWVPKVLMTVGCAVITLLLFKRLRIAV